jgi:hypothetical protein
VSLRLQPGYKLFPLTWEKDFDEMQTAFDAVLQDSRFAAQSCCLRQMVSGSGSGYLVWCPPTMEARGDPTLEFDTGVMWHRASELMVGLSVHVESRRQIA